MKGLSVAVNILASEGRQEFMPPWQCSLETSRGVSLLERANRAQEGMHALSTDQQRAAVAPGHRVWASGGLLFMWLCPKQSVNTVFLPSPLWKWAD